MSRWFWNSKIVGWVESLLVSISNWVWKRRREALKPVSKPVLTPASQMPAKKEKPAATKAPAKKTRQKKNANV